MAQKKINWVTLTNKHGRKVSVRHERIVLLTERDPVDTEVMAEVCHTLVECSDKISLPVRETREDIMSLMDATEMLLEEDER